MQFLYNLKMGFKLSGAFGLLVIMTAVVTLNGMMGMSRFNSEVEIADDFNRIVKYTGEIRIAEKNLALRNDEAYAGEIKDLISKSNVDVIYRAELAKPRLKICLMRWLNL